MTSIIVAGRSGSAFAAEIGTMKINEEIDALFTMGFDTIRFLAIPKIIASVIVVPLLDLFSVLFIIFGGLIIGISMFSLTSSAYIAKTVRTLFDIFWGFFKSGIFGLLRIMAEADPKYLKDRSQNLFVKRSFNRQDDG